MTRESALTPLAAVASGCTANQPRQANNDVPSSVLRPTAARGPMRLGIQCPLRVVSGHPLLQRNTAELAESELVFLALEKLRE